MAKNQIMIFADYFYDDHSLQQQIKAAGLNIDKIKNYYTEERSIMDGTKPKIELDKTITDAPPFVIYHLSKPVNKICYG